MTHCIPSTARNGQCDIAVDRHGFHIATSSHIHDHKCGPHPTQKKTKVTSGSLTTAFESSLLFLLSPPSSPLFLLSPYFCISLRFLFCSLTHSSSPQLHTPHRHGTAANVTSVSTTTLLFVADMLAPVLPPPLHLHTLHSHRSTSTLTPHGTCLLARGTVTKVTL